MAMAGGLAASAAGSMSAIPAEIIDEAGDLAEAVVHEVGAMARDFFKGPGPLPPHGCTTKAGERCRTCESWKANWREHRTFVGMLVVGAVGATFVITKEIADGLAAATGQNAWLNVVGLPFGVAGPILAGLIGSAGNQGGGP